MSPSFQQLADVLAEIVHLTSIDHLCGSRKKPNYFCIGLLVINTLNKHSSSPKPQVTSSKGVPCSFRLEFQALSSLTQEHQEHAPTKDLSKSADSVHSFGLTDKPSIKTHAWNWLQELDCMC